MKTISYNVCVFWLKQADEGKVVLLVIKVTQGRLKQADEGKVVYLAMHRELAILMFYDHFIEPQTTMILLNICDPVEQNRVCHKVCFI